MRRLLVGAALAAVVAGCGAASTNAPLLDTSTAAPTFTAVPPVAPVATVKPKVTAKPKATPRPSPKATAQAGPYADAKAAGATAVCADGNWNYSAHRSGACSGHGGVHWWTGNVGPAGPGAH